MGLTSSKSLDVIAKEEQDDKMKYLEEKIDMLEKQNILFKTQIDTFSIHNQFNPINSIKEIQKNHDYEYIILSGGGIKGLCYPGSFIEMQQLDILYDKKGLLKLKGLCGVSAGSIMASLIAIGYTPLELERIMLTLNFEILLNDNQGIIKDTINFVEKWGMCPGNNLYELLGNLIEKKTGNADYTIENLKQDKNINLVLVTTNISYQRVEYLYAGNKETAYSQIPIRTAIRMSMGIPYIYEPYSYNNCLFVDGGTLNNYPLTVFDGDYPGDPNAMLNLCPPNPKVLGLMIMAKEDSENYQIVPKQKLDTLYEYSISYINMFLTSNERRIMTPSFWLRTIILITPNYPLSKFNITLKEKEELIEIGKKSVAEFFKP